jgi:hypothetical protein
LGNEYAARDKEDRRDRSVSHVLRSQVDMARGENENAPSLKRLHFSTWLIDALAPNGKTPGLLIIFPFNINKDDMLKSKFEEAIQNAFAQIYLT